uniref:CCHC-type domain-containing protein n=1 Tax=Tanacetum cinerariifolium TaxID=118510 RepID=A0A699H2G2_TANCI|nr:hypothetical protein [Tanacetum cinerariifolium]
MIGEELSQPPQPSIASTEASQMVSSVKLPILKKGEYILWTIKMEQYLAHTDYAMWEVILNGNSVVQMTKDDAGIKIEVPPITTQQILARTRETKAKSTLIMAIPDEHLARFHGIKDAKTLWAAIKTRFGEGLDKRYDRFQRLLSLLDIHGAGIDNLDIDDLYKNLKVYEDDIKGSSGSSSNSQNVAFVFAKSTNSTNELNAASSVSTATGYNKEDLEQIDQEDLEEMDLKWQVAMLSMRVKRFYKKTRRKLMFNGKEQVGFDKNKVECFNCHRRGYFARDCRSGRSSGNKSRDARNAGYKGRDNGKRPTKEEDEQALVVHDGLGYDSQINEKEVLDIKEEEVTETVFDNRSSDEENSVANDRFKKGKGYHVVPPPLIGNYMPPKPDLLFVGLDDSIYKFKISETVTSLAKDEKDAPETSTACVEKPKEDRSRNWSQGKKTNLEQCSKNKSSKKFAPTTLFTRSGRIPVSAAKPKATTSTNAAKPVNTAGPKQSVNFSRTRSTFHKSHSPIRRFFYNAIAHSRRNSTERVNIVGSKADSVVKGNEVTAVKTSAGPQVTNNNAGTQDNVDAGKEVSDQHYIVLPLWSSICFTYKSLDDNPADDKPKDDTGSKTVEEPVNKEDQAYRDELDRLMSQEKEASDAADALRKEFKQGCMDQRGVTQAVSTNSLILLVIQLMLETAKLKSTGIFKSAYDDDLDIYTSPVQSVGAEAEFNNMESSTKVSLIPTHKMKRKKVSQALDDESWVEAIQEELLQFSLQKVWKLVDMLYEKKATETKWVYRNKKDEMGIAVRN